MLLTLFFGSKGRDLKVPKITKIVSKNQGGCLRTFPYESFSLEVCIFITKKDMKISNTAFDRSGSEVFSHVIFNVISALKNF